MLMMADTRRCGMNNVNLHFTIIILRMKPIRFLSIPVKNPVEVKESHVSDMRPLNKDRHKRRR